MGVCWVPQNEHVRGGGEGGVVVTADGGVGVGVMGDLWGSFLREVLEEADGDVTVVETVVLMGDAVEVGDDGFSGFGDAEGDMGGRNEVDDEDVELDLVKGFLGSFLAVVLCMESFPSFSTIATFLLLAVSLASSSDFLFSVVFISVLLLAFSCSTKDDSDFFTSIVNNECELVSDDDVISPSSTSPSSNASSSSSVYGSFTSTISPTEDSSCNEPNTLDGSKAFTEVVEEELEEEEAKEDAEVAGEGSLGTMVFLVMLEERMGKPSMGVTGTVVVLLVV
jgi:hypothetical protein